ncbi:hypothetical protein TNCV_4922021 [Trichonephila clavipes]|nr:hypothetical protein TNCV_4922021 [Trichonephila clavipes]
MARNFRTILWRRSIPEGRTLFKELHSLVNLRKEYDISEGGGKNYRPSWCYRMDCPATLVRVRQFVSDTSNYMRSYGSHVCSAFGFLAAIG